jgi:L-threonylcarbamoyladenylate synthase
MPCVQFRPDSAGIIEAAQLVKQGGVLAYPTEGVFGLGCCPQNQSAVLKLLRLKNRSPTQGLILIAAQFCVLRPYLALSTISSARLAEIQQSWPGPYTWIFPASEYVPHWIKGNFSTVAVRVTQHPLAAQLCQQFTQPLVSTSANITGTPATTTYQAVLAQLGTQLEGIISGKVQNPGVATQIGEVLTGKILRPA